MSCQYAQYPIYMLIMSLVSLSTNPHSLTNFTLQISWTKDGEEVFERGSESGLSAIHISRNGKLVIEVLCSFALKIDLFESGLRLM